MGFCLQEDVDYGLRILECRVIEGCGFQGLEFRAWVFGVFWCQKRSTCFGNFIHLGHGLMVLIMMLSVV